MKTVLHKFVRRWGFDFVKITGEERRLLNSNFNLNLRHIGAESALNLPCGEISIGEARFLGNLVSGLKSDGPIIEIGTLFGTSTRILVYEKDPQRELLTVDNYSWNPLGFPPEIHYKITANILSEATSQLNVRQVKMDKDEFYVTYKGSTPSLIFLDAMHSYEATRDDIAWARKTGAEVICGHDYSQDWPGVMQAVNELGGPKFLQETLWVL